MSKGYTPGRGGAGYRKRKWDDRGETTQRQQPYPHPYNAFELANAKRTFKRLFNESQQDDFEAIKAKLEFYQNDVSGCKGWGEASTKFCEANFAQDDSTNGSYETPGKKRKVKEATAVLPSTSQIETSTSTSRDYTDEAGPSTSSDSTDVVVVTDDDPQVVDLVETGVQSNDNSVISLSDDSDGEDAVILESSSYSVVVLESSSDSEEDCVIEEESDCQALFVIDRNPSSFELSVETGDVDVKVSQPQIASSHWKKPHDTGMTSSCVDNHNSSESTDNRKPLETGTGTSSLTLMCDYCCSLFENPKELKHHLAEQNHYSGGLVSVKHDSEGNLVPQFYKDAMVVVNESALFKTYMPVCPICHKGFSTIIQCVNHYTINHKKRTGFYLLANIKQKKTIQLNLNPYERCKCFECSHVFNTPKKLKKHIKTQHPPDSGCINFYVCQLCAISLPFTLQGVVNHYKGFPECAAKGDVCILSVETGQSTPQRFLPVTDRSTQVALGVKVSEHRKKVARCPEAKTFFDKQILYLKKNEHKVKLAGTSG